MYRPMCTCQSLTLFIKDTITDSGCVHIIHVYTHVANHSCCSLLSVSVRSYGLCCGPLSSECSRNMANHSAILVDSNNMRVMFIASFSCNTEVLSYQWRPYLFVYVVSTDNALHDESSFHYLSPHVCIYDSSDGCGYNILYYV